jgi:hypothetical protein
MLWKPPLIAAVLSLSGLAIAALHAPAAAAAPRSVTCLQTVTIAYDDSRYALSGEAPKPDGACELALQATPASNYGVQVLSLSANPKEFKKIKKMKAEARLQLLANQLAGGNAASPVQEVEPVGQFGVGFSVSQGPSGGLSAKYIAVTAVGQALLYVVLEHRADRVPGAAPLDRVAARNELLSLLAGVRIDPPVKGKK